MATEQKQMLDVISATKFAHVILDAVEQFFKEYSRDRYDGLLIKANEVLMPNCETKKVKIKMEIKD